jgi:penicillin amidase
MGLAPASHWVKRILVILVVMVIIIAAGLYFGLPRLNSFKTGGELTVPGLKDPVKIQRDEKAMAYIDAQSLDDAIFAQGFVTAQDRLFQMQLTRLFAQGRIGELAGKGARGLDIRMRTLGIHRAARRQAALLDDDTRRFFQRYVDGINAFIHIRPQDIPMEFKLAGIKAEEWSVADSLSILYYMAYSISANLSTEIIAQALLETIGPDKTRDILPININPDDPEPVRRTAVAVPGRSRLGLENDTFLTSFIGDHPLRIGSNNWTVGPRLAPGGQPILAGDPHLDARILPGVWHTFGLKAPGVRLVGANVPGLPGIALGRAEHIAISMTNNYGDVQDLFIETVDPNDPGRYMEGDKSKPFTIIEEELKFKDKNAPGGLITEKIKIRATGRGPVVSGALAGLDASKVITFRWAPAESMGRTIGISRFMTAKSTAEIDRCLTDVPMLLLNWVFADDKGNIGYRASGRVPLRRSNSGTFPHRVVGGQDEWVGWIPDHLMPHASNPDRHWLGTCNHKTIGADYPYYYSTYFAPSFRYRRLKELMAQPGPKAVDDHWRFQRDAKNLMAMKIAPLMAVALEDDPATASMSRALQGWDFVDDKNSAGPAVFQAAYRLFAREVFVDELGPRVTDLMLTSWYFWEERLLKMVEDNNSSWFDDTRTKDKVETRDDLFRRSARMAQYQWRHLLGEDPVQWEWGKVHTLELVSPLRRSGFGKTLVGSGPMPMGGSGETLYRGWYAWEDPFAVTNSASLRMVADLSDLEKVVAVLPAGVWDRTFSPHIMDQTKAFMDGKKLYWWFSDKALARHVTATLTLNP